MSAAAGVRPITAGGFIAAARTRNSSLFHNSLWFQIKPLCPHFSLGALLPSILSLSSHHHRLLPSSASNVTEFSEAYEEEDAFEEYHGNLVTTPGQKQREHSPRSSSIESRRLYVGNLPFTTTSSELSEIFSQAGEIDQVEIIYARDTNRSRGFAFVTMASAEDAKNAILMFDGAQISGRTAKVNFPEVPKGGEREVMGPKLRSNSRLYVDSPHKIYAGNLGWMVTSEELRDAFSAYSGLLGAKVVYERDSGRSRGFGFINFASSEECQSALEAMDGKMVLGRALRLNLATDKGQFAALSVVEPSPTPECNGHEIGVDQESSLKSNLV